MSLYLRQVAPSEALERGPGCRHISLSHCSPSSPGDGVSICSFILISTSLPFSDLRLLRRFCQSGDCLFITLLLLSSLNCSTVLFLQAIGKKVILCKYYNRNIPIPKCVEPNIQYLRLKYPSIIDISLLINFLSILPGPSPEIQMQTSVCKNQRGGRNRKQEAACARVAI